MPGGPVDPLGAVLAGTAAWYRRRFANRNCRVGKSCVVHAVRTEPSWVGGHEVPVPACRVGVSGWDLAAMTPAAGEVTCRRCLRLRPERAVTGDHVGRPAQLALNLDIYVA